MTKIVCGLAFALLATAAFAQQVTIDLDAAATQIHWSLVGNVHTTHGTFQLKEGQVKVDPGAGSISGELVVETASGNSNNGARDSRMKKEVLETDKYPEARLKFTKAESPIALGNGATVRLSGQFSIHGAAHEVTIPIELTVAGDQITGKGKFVVPFVDWGMKDPSNFLFKVNKTVEVEVQAVGHIKAN